MAKEAPSALTAKEPFDVDRPLSSAPVRGTGADNLRRM